MTDESKEPWHIKREIQIGHLVSTAVVAFSVIWYAGKLEQRVALVEQSVSLQKERDATQDIQAAAAQAQINAQLARIDAKLDRIIETRTR
jgi:hypothetical protein